MSRTPPRQPLYGTDNEDSSWSPFDDDAPRTPRSQSQQNVDSDELSLSSQTIPKSEPTTATSSDSLFASLTRIDPETADLPTREIPFLGEIPRDGSLLLLAPVALIGVLGIFLTIYIGFTSKDSIVEEIQSVTTVISTPPVSKNVIESGCRGLCSNQGESLEYLRGAMEGMKISNQ